MEHTCPKCNHTFEVKRKKTQKETDPRINALIKLYIAEFKNAFGSEPFVNWGACGKMLKKLLSSHPDSTIAGYIRDYIKTDDEWLRDKGQLRLTLLEQYMHKRAVQKPKDSIPEWKKGPV